jgi:hypothetical protein
VIERVRSPTTELTSDSGLFKAGFSQRYPLILQDILPNTF